jgi:dihydrofolate reductase
MPLQLGVYCPLTWESSFKEIAMQKLVVFNQVTLDGYIADANGDMRWAHKDRQDAEWNAFVAGNAQGGGTLPFGRVTYDLMNSYLPTAMAMKNDPVVAERMNNLPKIVFSRTLEKASWSNTRLVKDGMLEEVRKLKSGPGEGMAILGSASVVAQLAQEGLIDEYQIVVNPVALGSGKTMFEGIREKLALKLTETRPFANGNILLCYEPLG